MVNPPVLEELEDGLESAYGDGKSISSEDSDHKSGTDSGEDEVVDSDWWGKNDHQTSGQKQPSCHVHPDKDLWEEQLVDVDIVLQDILYFDIIMNSPTDPPPPPHTPLPDAHLVPLTWNTHIHTSFSMSF